jgi:hypothetical protein
VTLQEVKFVRQRVFHSALLKTTKLVFKIWATIAIIPTTTQAATLIRTYLISVSLKTHTIA